MVIIVRSLAAAFLLVAGIAAASAQERPILTVYTYDSFAAEWGPGPAIKTGFEAQCVCTLDFVTTEDAITTLRRVQLEGAATDADVVVGLDTGIVAEARRTGLFAEHGVDLSGLALPHAWSDATFAPFDYGYFAFVYNTELVPHPPGSFEELIALPDDFKIVLEDPRSSTPGLGLVAWIATAYGERAPQIWAGLKPHILTMTRGWSEAYGLFQRNEADMVLSYTTSPAYHVIAENDPRYAAAQFAEGHVAQIELAAIVAGSPRQALAARFIAYLVSRPSQQVIPTTNWMYPVIDLGPDLPAQFPPPPVKVLVVDEAGMAANRDRWIDEALAAID